MCPPASAQNVIDGCVAGGVPALVLTSSASVVFEGRDLHAVDEAAPYAAHPMDFYTHTKIEGGWEGVLGREVAGSG